MAALLAAWWLGTRTERSREAVARADRAALVRRQDESAAADPIADFPKERTPEESPAAFPGRPAQTPDTLAARIGEARRAPTDLQRLRRLIIATADLSAEEIPAALALAANGGGQREEKEILRLGIMARWAELDAPAAAAYAAGQLTAGRNIDSETFKLVVGEWGVRDPAGAADFVAALGDEQRGYALAGLLAGVAASQPETALALLGRFPEAAKQGESYKVIFGAWSERDPRSAAGRAAALPAGEFRESALDGIAERWSQRDPRSAYAWATQLGDAAERETARKTTLRTWAQSDPQGAANQALGLGDATVLRGVADYIARELVQRDLPAAQRFAAGLADNDARATAQQAVAFKLGEKNAAEATAYAAQMPEGAARQSVLYGLCATWFLRDPVATAQWLGTLPASGSRDFAVSAYVERAVEVDPESALAWAASMTGTEKRTESLGNAYAAWQKKAPQAAQAWLDADRTLPAETKAALAGKK